MGLCETFWVKLTVELSAFQLEKWENIIDFQYRKLPDVHHRILKYVIYSGQSG